MSIRRRRSTVGAGLPAMDEYQPAHLPTVTPPSRASPLPQGFVVLVEAGLLGVERRQTGGVGGRVLLAFGHRNGLDRAPQVITQPVLAAFAVQRAIQPIQGIGQRHKPRGHVGQRFRLLPCPGVEGLAGSMRVVGGGGWWVCGIIFFYIYIGEGG